MAIDFETTSEIDLYRFYSSNQRGDKYGPWLVDGDDIDQLAESGASLEDVREKYSLPDRKDKVAELTVDPGTSLRTGTVGENFGESGGGLQYNIQEPELKKRASNMEENDYPGTWTSDNNDIDLRELLDGDTDLQYRPPSIVYAMG